MTNNDFRLEWHALGGDCHKIVVEVDKIWWLEMNHGEQRCIRTYLQALRTYIIANYLTTTAI